MKETQKLTTTQSIGLAITRQQLKFVHLLEKNAPEIEEEIENELRANPALEEVPGTREEQARIESAPGSHSYVSYVHSADSAVDFSPPDTSETLYDYLRVQLSEKKVSQDVRLAAEYLIDSIDSNGYLRRSLPLIAEDMEYHHDLVPPRGVLEQAVAIIKSLDPAGVGAADLRECLLLQLQRMPESQTRDDALRIIEKNYDAFIKKHYHKIVSGLRIKADRAEKAVDLIRQLNPKPGASFGSDTADAVNVIIPDFIVGRDENSGKFIITINNRIPELRIEQSFDEAFRSIEVNARGKKIKGNEFVVSHYREANDFIRVLKQRQQTLFDVMTAIVKIQFDYFVSEDVYKLRPMMIKDIAAITGLDISTISRATANKFVSLPWGIFPLRFFFSDSVGSETDTDALTNRKIEAEIRKIVDAEDKRHPLSDEKIRLAMVERGYDISRRTVAKYRDRCEIPVARLRKD